MRGRGLTWLLYEMAIYQGFLRYFYFDAELTDKYIFFEINVYSNPDCLLYPETEYLTLTRKGI